ncbi:MAG: hypothetical protein JXB48_14095 [Candidatus Latescibacteria bacterium]|nr:hypothetical protein [Candidatus Latescibacterota bacterium]
MKICNKIKVEDCFDGSSVFEYFFNSAWSKNEIYSLECMGHLEYFPEFPRPFFRVIQKGGLQIKGVEGDTKCRVILPKKNREKTEILLENTFSNI